MLGPPCTQKHFTHIINIRCHIAASYLFVLHLQIKNSSLLAASCPLRPRLYCLFFSALECYVWTWINYLQQHLCFHARVCVCACCESYLGQQEQRSARTRISVLIPQLKQFRREDRRSKETQEKEPTDGQILHILKKLIGFDRKVNEPTDWLVG